MACSFAVVCEPRFAPHSKRRENIQSGNKQQERASGRTIRGCLAVRGYASAAVITLVRQSSNSALHVGWRKYLPSSTTD